jgi:hypothetical protein
MTEPDSMTVTWTVAWSDYLDAFRTSRPFRFWTRPAVIALGASATLYEAFIDRVTWWYDVGIVTIAVGIIWWQGLRTMRSYWTGQLQGVTLAPEGVHMVFPGIDSLVDWAAVTGVDQTRSSVLLLSGQHWWTAIPRHAFSSDTDLDEFVAFARARLRTTIT